MPPTDSASPPRSSLRGGYGAAGQACSLEWMVDVYRSFTEPGLTCMFVTMLPTVDIIMVVTVMMFVYTLSRFSLARLNLAHCFPRLRRLFDLTQVVGSLQI